MWILLLLFLDDCTACGKTLRERANFCTACGARAIRLLDEAEAAFVRARDLKARGEWVEARKELDRAIELHPLRKYYYLKRGTVKLEIAGGEMEAIEDFALVLRLDPKNVEARLGRAAALVRLSRFRDSAIEWRNAALVHLEDAIALDPTRVRAWLQLGELQLERGEGLSALSALDEAVRLNRIPVTLLARARGRFHLGHPREALEDGDEALRESPSAEGYLLRSAIRAALGRWGDALDDCTKALQERPELAETWIQRGHLRMRLGQFAEAAGDFTRALALRADDVDSLIARGRAYYESRAIDAALADWHRALELRPLLRMTLMPWMEMARTSRGER